MHQKAKHREMVKAERATKHQGQGSSPRGEAVTSCAFEMQPLEPCNEARQLKSLSYQAWLPDGARKQASQPLMTMLDKDEALSALILNLPLAKRDCQLSSKRLKSAPEATFTPTAAGLHPVAQNLPANENSDLSHSAGNCWRPAAKTPDI